jgi:hypothetical protein
LLSDLTTDIFASYVCLERDGTMKTLLIGLASASVALAGATEVSAAIVFESAYLQVGAYAQASSGTGYQSSSGSDSDSAVALPVTPMTAETFADAKVIKSGLQAQATAEEKGEATFASPASGTVNFLSATTAFVAPTSPDGYAYAYDNGSYFSYNFTVFDPTPMSVAFDLIHDNSVDFYNGFVQVTGLTNGYANTYYPLENTTGILHFDLPGGDTYQLSLSNYYYTDYLYQSGPGSLTGGRNDTYAFTIGNAVPEPATWAMMIVGFFGLGSAMRLSRRHPQLLLAQAA